MTDVCEQLPKRPLTTPGRMGWVIMALLPALILNVANGNIRLLEQLLIVCPLALVLEAVVLRLRRLPVRFHLGDGSALLTAILLCLLLPAPTPWYLLPASVCVATAGKHLFGGLGQNLFNPALLAYLAVVVVAPALTLYGATPWASDYGLSARADLLVALALLAGGLVVLGLGIIKWQLPLVYMATLTVMLLVFNLPLAATTSMLAAFFLITDPVTSPSTAVAKTVYAALAGVLTGVLTLHLYQPAATAVAMLAMNTLVPMLDQLMQSARGSSDHPRRKSA